MRRTPPAPPRIPSRLAAGPTPSPAPRRYPRLSRSAPAHAGCGLLRRLRPGSVRAIPPVHSFRSSPRSHGAALGPTKVGVGISLKLSSITHALSALDQWPVRPSLIELL